MSVLLLNLVLQIVLLPVYLLILIGGDVAMNAATLVGSTAMVLVILFVLSCITKTLTKKTSKIRTYLSEQGDNLRLLFLCLAVVVMFASEGKNMTDNPMLLVQMFLQLLIFFTVLFFVAQLAGYGPLQPKVWSGSTFEICIGISSCTRYDFSMPERQVKPQMALLPDIRFTSAQKTKLPLN